MRRLRFVWIDDRKDKVTAFTDAIEAGTGASTARAAIELIHVKSDILQALSAWTASRGSDAPDLFIIDHVFNVTLPFGLSGSSVAHLLRGNYPTTPMVCVTAKFSKPGTFDQDDLSEYMAVIPYGQLGDHIGRLYAIAKDFPKIKVGNQGVREHLVKSLKAPRRDRDDLLRVLPDEFQTQRHSTTEHRIARWIYNVLLPRPGFLYDRLHSATLLGLTESGFAKVESVFRPALYRGVFATSQDPRWWVSEIKRTLFVSGGEASPSEPQLAGRLLPGIHKADYSVCYVSKKTEPPPDSVVFADGTPDAEPRVVSHQFAARHPEDPGTMPGFETRLVLRTRRR